MSFSDYEGKIIHRTRDEFGELIVTEGAMNRSLYFGQGAKQSSMFVDFPDDLTMHYSRAMMSGLIFNPHPRNSLLIGLGGGSIVKFLIRACPECRLDVIELRGKVIDLSHEFFALPRTRPNLNIMQADGREYVFKCEQTPDCRYDLILVDAYDDSGQVDEVADREFITAAKECLTRQGILVYNLWNRSEGNYYHCRNLINSIFAGSHLQLVLEGDKGHAIIFAFRTPISMNEVKNMKSNARDLQAAFHISFPKFLDTIVRQNS
ncbi:hypothetical protein ACFL6N_03565 [Thermodesulfobacteriota bacterium]